MGNTVQQLSSIGNRYQSGVMYEHHFDEPQVAPPHEVSKQLAVTRIDVMTNQMLKERNGEEYRNYKTYLLANSQAQLLHVKMMNEHNLAPCVAAYALFSTDFVSIDAAMDFIFEKRQDGSNNKMQHIFVAYVPEAANAV